MNNIKFKKWKETLKTFKIRWANIRDAKRDLNPREFSFSFSNFENFRERGQLLGSRIYEGNPQNFSKFENENEGVNFENS